VEITTVADDLLVVHDGHEVLRFDGLRPDSDLDQLGLGHLATTHAGADVRTLARPGGELLCRFATVNDVHFGEVEAGRVGDLPDGPIQRAEPGEPPYPETMNRAAVTEIRAIEPAAVLVKGDLTCNGEPAEFAAFEACYRTAFGERLHVVRGNHDAYRGQHVHAGDRWVELPGVCIALLDTVIPMQTTGTVRADQLEWLDDMAGTDDDRPVLVMGHHQQWIPGGTDGAGQDEHRSEGYFGLHPDASDALAELVARRRRVVAYTAGHTHRHRVRHMSGGVPTIEVGCVKDFPGTWAEYRVYEGGIQQVVHRISDPAALAWSERCRGLYRDFGIDYQSYALGRLEDRCLNIPPRTQ
jgi:predicted phosphodiesterase